MSKGNSGSNLGLTPIFDTVVYVRIIKLCQNLIWKSDVGRMIDFLAILQHSRKSLIHLGLNFNLNRDQIDFFDPNSWNLIKLS